MNDPKTTSSIPATSPEQQVANVTHGAFLTLHYRLSGDLSGDSSAVVDTFATGQPSTLSLGQGQLAPVLEEKLLGLSEGQSASFEIPAGENGAFGLRNPELMQWVSAKLLHEMGDPQEQYLPGEVVEFPTPDGQGSYAGAVVQVREDGAVLFDFNHPLAGKAVRFDVQIIGIL